MPATKSPPNTKQITTEFQNGIRRLVSMAFLDSTSLPPVEQLRDLMTTSDSDVAAARSRSSTVLAVKDDLARLEKEINENRNQAKAADQALAALAQQVGEAAFRSFLEGRAIELPEIASRKELQDQVDTLKREKEELAKAPAGGVADKAKSFAQQTALSGRLVLLQQKVASADKVLGNSILQVGKEAEVLPQNCGELLTKIVKSRKSIDTCRKAIVATEQQEVDRLAKARLDLGIEKIDATSLDAEYCKCTDKLVEAQSQKMKARWNCGEALLSVPSEQLPASIASLAARLRKLKSENPKACEMPSVDKRVLTADLKEQVTILYELLGNEVYKQGVFKDKLSSEFGMVESADEWKRAPIFRKLGEAVLKNRDETFASSHPLLQAISHEIESNELTVKELDGGSLLGTGGKSIPVSTGAVVGMVGCLAVCVIFFCGGAITAALKGTKRHAQEQGRVAEAKQATPKMDVSTTAVEMATIRTANELRFDADYKGKVTQITGVVKSVGKAMFGEQYVTLIGTDKYQIVCYCGSPERPKLAKLSPGETVTLIGNYSQTVYLSIWMTDCVIADSESGTTSPAVSSATHPKLIAFFNLVEKYKRSPKDQLTTDTERTRFIKELEPIQESFLTIRFEPHKNPVEARNMIDTFQNTIYRKYSGHLYNIFEAQMVEMKAEFTDR